MRDAFAAEVTALAKTDPRIVLLSGDIGNRLFDNFKKIAPDRFYNCGVAEANMMSLASGLAQSGLRPVVYTIDSFLTTRCFEQIRLDLCYHNVPVVFVGVGAGLGYASLGATHHACEDIAILRALPNMTIVCPGDPVEVKLATREALKEKGPVYIRLGKKGEAIIHKQEPAFKIGKAIVVQDGSKICLLSTGNTLPLAIEAAEKCQRQGITPRVVSFHTVKPLDLEFLKQAFSEFAVVATIEEHSRLGGLGGAVAEWLSDQKGLKARLCRIGTEDRFLHEAGEQEYAREQFGLTADAIAEQTLSLLTSSQ